MKAHKYFSSWLRMGAAKYFNLLSIEHSDAERSPFGSFGAEGRLKEAWDKGYFGLLQRDGAECDFIGNGVNMAISARAKHVLEDNIGSEEAEFHPLPLRSPSGEIRVEGYWIPIWSNIIDCIIPSMSAVVVEKRIGNDRSALGEWMSISKSSPAGPLVLKQEPIENAKIFRLYRQELTIIFREDVVKAIKKAGLTGFRLRSHKEYPVLVYDKKGLERLWRCQGKSESQIEILMKM